MVILTKAKTPLFRGIQDIFEESHEISFNVDGGRRIINARIYQPVRERELQKWKIITKIQARNTALRLNCSSAEYIEMIYICIQYFWRMQLLHRETKV